MNSSDLTAAPLPSFFFLASQHPAARKALRRLAGPYLMPARMWRHGIHSFLELLRHRLPQCYDQMLTFIYLAYGMMALLYETVSAFEDTWIECLGDLARYRMAIEDNDTKDRETWTVVARSWYSLASKKDPATGGLYHHLAILARPNAVQQLFFYVKIKSLCVRTAFPSARESIMTLFNPLFGPKRQDVDMEEPVATEAEPDATFIKARSFMMRTHETAVRRWGDPAQQSSISIFNLLFNSGPPIRKDIPTQCFIRSPIPRGISTRALCKILKNLAPTIAQLATCTLCIQPTLASEEKERTKEQLDVEIPSWIFPVVFTTFALGVHWAGWYYSERQKWFVVAMAVSNLFFPWLAEHERVSPVLTASVFITAAWFGFAFALTDYANMRPPPGFYMTVLVFGLIICATINSICQTASIAGLNSTSGGNPFSVYLLLSMTASMVIGGRIFAAYLTWLEQHGLSYIRSSNTNEKNARDDGLTSELRGYNAA